MAEGAEGSAGEPMAKRPRIEAEDPNSKTMLTALTAAKGVCGVDLKVGLRLQVRWSVIADEEEGEQAEGNVEGDVAEGEADKSNAKAAAEPASGDGQKKEEGGESSAEGAAENKEKDQGEAAEEEDYVWWGCHLDSLKTDKGPYGPIWVLKYDAMTVRLSSHSFPSAHFASTPPPCPPPRNNKAQDAVRMTDHAPDARVCSCESPSSTSLTQEYLSKKPGPSSPTPLSMSADLILWLLRVPERPRVPTNRPVIYFLPRHR